jgi:carbamoyltransferase
MSACLLQNGTISCVIEEERLSLVKHSLPKAVSHLWPEYNGRFGYFPWASVCYCLDAAKLAIDDLDAIVLSSFPTADFPSVIPIKDKTKIVLADQPPGGEHHFVHALSAFFASPFEDAAVLVVDGDGSAVPGQGYEAESGYVFDDRSGSYREIFKNRYLERGIGSGIGWMYDVVSAALGFVNTRIGYLADPGKTMGLAPYGKHRQSLAEPWIRRDGFRLDLTGFYTWAHALGIDKIARYEDRNRALIQNEANIPDYAMDLAFKVQTEVEQAMVGLCLALMEATKKDKVCLAGGVALNSVANGLLSASGSVKELFVQPAAGDNGQAIGLAYYGHLRLASKIAIQPIRHAFGGRSYSDAEIEELLEASGLPYERIDSEERVASEAVDAMVDGKIIGWFQEGSEYGPRALGHRSILADPRPAGMMDRVNSRVKFREHFRPFAPSVLAEHAREIFDLHHDSPYMLIVAPVRAGWRDKIPAITHVDGSARIQTVDRHTNAVFARLIDAFARKTGVPLLLNTSFNLRGMPMVESPRDALRAFLYTEMDLLFLGRYKVPHADMSSATPEMSLDWKLSFEVTTDWQRDVTARGEFLHHHGTVPPVSIADLPRLRTSQGAIPDEINTLGSFVLSLDGQTPVADALRAAVGGEVDPELLVSARLLVQSLLRRGILRLKLGTFAAL